MKNLLKKFYDIVLSEESLNDTIPNIDTVTLEFMQTNILQDYVAYAQKAKEDKALQSLLEGVANNANVTELVALLNSAESSRCNKTAQFIENTLAKVEGINLEGKSIASILWASTILGFITDESHAHSNTSVFTDPLEMVTIQYMRSTVYKVKSKISINNLRSEMISIFKDTQYYVPVQEYIARALLKNSSWQSDVNQDRWFDPLTLNEIKIDASQPIENDEQLIEALKTGTVSNYQRAINYVRGSYINEHFGATRKTLESSLVVGLIASTLASSDLIENSDELSSVSFNLLLKAINSREIYEQAIKKHNQFMVLNKGYTEALYAPFEDATKIALTILGQLSKEQDIPMAIGVEGDLAEGYTVEEIEDEEEKKQPNIKVGNKNAYIKAYLDLFNKLIEAQKDEYISIIAKMNNIKPLKEEELVIETARRFGISNQLKTEEEIPGKKQRVYENAQIVAEAIRQRVKTLSLIPPIFNKVRGKNKTNLDIQDLIFDQKLLGKLINITEDVHEDVIKEFYALIENDPILKQDQASYRLFLSQKMTMSELKGRGENNSSYPIISGMLKLVSTTNKTEAERTVYKLYVDGEGNIDEKYEELYTVLTSKSTIEEKRFALESAQEKGIITPEQYEKINNYLIEIANKSIKNKQVEGQMEIDFDNKPASETDGDENENE